MSETFKKSQMSEFFYVSAGSIKVHLHLNILHEQTAKSEFRSLMFVIAQCEHKFGFSRGFSVQRFSVQGVSV